MGDKYESMVDSFKARDLEIPDTPTIEELQVKFGCLEEAPGGRSTQQTEL